jgi:hypothetical protein
MTTDPKSATPVYDEICALVARFEKEDSPYHLRAHRMTDRAYSLAHQLDVLYAERNPAPSAASGLEERAIKAEGEMRYFARNIGERVPAQVQLNEWVEVILALRSHQAPVGGEILPRLKAAGKCEHKERINRGYQDGYDMAWCSDCGVITWCSDGLISDSQAKRNDRWEWCKRHVEAYVCARETGTFSAPEKKCNQWCGQSYCSVSLRALKTPSPQTGGGS